MELYGKLGDGVFATLTLLEGSQQADHASFHSKTREHVATSIEQSGYGLVQRLRESGIAGLVTGMWWLSSIA